MREGGTEFGRRGVRPNAGSGEDPALCCWRVIKCFVLLRLHHDSFPFDIEDIEDIETFYFLLTFDEWNHNVHRFSMCIARHTWSPSPKLVIFSCLVEETLFETKMGECHHRTSRAVFFPIFRPIDRFTISLVLNSGSSIVCGNFRQSISSSSCVAGLESVLGQSRSDKRCRSLSSVYHEWQSIHSVPFYFDISSWSREDDPMQSWLYMPSRDRSFPRHGYHMAFPAAMNRFVTNTLSELINRFRSAFFVWGTPSCSIAAKHSL